MEIRIGNQNPKRALKRRDYRNWITNPFFFYVGTRKKHVSNIFINAMCLLKLLQWLAQGKRWRTDDMNVKQAKSETFQSVTEEIDKHSLPFDTPYRNSPQNVTEKTWKTKSRKYNQAKEERKPRKKDIVIFQQGERDERDLFSSSVKGDCI